MITELGRNLFASLLEFVVVLLAIFFKDDKRKMAAVLGIGTVFAGVIGFGSQIQAFLRGIQPIREPTSIQTNPGFSDDFGSQRLSPNWAWIDPLGDSSYNLTDVPGNLRVTVPGSSHDFWGDQGFNAPRLVQHISGSFVATTKVTINPATFYQGAGILVQQDSNYWGNLQVGNLYGYREGYLFHKNNAPELLAGSVRLGSEAAYLRLKRCGNTITGLTSVDNANWQQIASISFPADSPVWVGLIAQSQRHSSNLVADFDHFTLSSCP